MLKKNMENEIVDLNKRLAESDGYVGELRGKARKAEEAVTSITLRATATEKRVEKVRQALITFAAIKFPETNLSPSDGFTICCFTGDEAAAKDTEELLLLKHLMSLLEGN